MRNKATVQVSSAYCSLCTITLGGTKHDHLRLPNTQHLITCAPHSPRFLITGQHSVHHGCTDMEALSLMCATLTASAVLASSSNLQLTHYTSSVLFGNCPFQVQQHEHYCIYLLEQIIQFEKGSTEK